MTGKYIAPRKGAKAFHCPHCGVYAQQSWFKLACGTFGRVTRFDALPKQFSLSACASCRRNALWYDDRMVYPGGSIAPLPSEDMPAEVRLDFEEARAVAAASPRAAAALLRLALLKLILPPSERAKESNGDLSRLVQKSFPEHIQEALNLLRVIGDDAAHPGQIDARDDAATALALFELVNMIVEKTITEHGRIQQVYGRPLGAGKTGTV